MPQPVPRQHKIRMTSREEGDKFLVDVGPGRIVGAALTFGAPMSFMPESVPAEVRPGQSFDSGARL
eukprot:11198367-Lingulodinium_polyedra.AAC.1